MTEPSPELSHTRGSGSTPCRSAPSDRSAPQRTSLPGSEAPSRTVRRRPRTSWTCWPTLADPGLMAMQSGRFFGWVIGGTLPAALAADWLVSAWDQNCGLRYATPAAAAAEEAAGAWLLDLLGLPAGAGVGFVTGATMANFAGLAAARSSVLSRSGWDLGRDGLNGGPRIQGPCRR